MDPTVNFRRALPIVLQPAEPALAALHALHPQSHDPTRCSRCGTNLVHRSTVVRKRSSRVHHSTCRICAAAVRTSLTPSHFPPTRKHGSSIPQPPRDPTPPPPPAAMSSQPPTPPTVKPRPKKKSALQQLLERNREKEHEQKKQKNSPQLGGLTSFLSGL